MFCTVQAPGLNLLGGMRKSREGLMFITCQGSCPELGFPP